MKLIIYFLKLIYILCLKKKNFSKLKKKQIIIYDGVGSNFLKPLVKNYDYSILETRLSRIKQINLSLQLIKLMLKNFFKFNLINNYLVSSIEILSPSLVITFIDNNPNYHIASKYFLFRSISAYSILKESVSIAPDLGNRSLTCPYEARTLKSLPRYLLMVFAFDGDSTINSLLIRFFQK